MNPFKEKAKKPEEYLSSIEKLYPKQYDKNETSPYTKTRIILACGAEYEATGTLIRCCATRMTST